MSTEEVAESYLAALHTAWGDSNDEEIDAWRAAAEAGAAALGIDTMALAELAELEHAREMEDE